MENPNLEIKHRKLKLRLAIDKHVVGLVSAGNMLGVEETCLGTRNSQYTQTESSLNVQNTSKSIQQKQLTNLRFIDSLKRANSFDSHEEEPSRLVLEESPKAKKQ